MGIEKASAIDSSALAVPAVGELRMRAGEVQVAGVHGVVIVPDVHAFPGHIACDSASLSEIVVPLIHDGKLLGVLDLDSPVLSRFDQQDADGLATTVQLLLQHSDLSRLVEL